MEPGRNGYFDMDGFPLYDDDILPVFDPNQHFTNRYKFTDEPLDLSFLESPYTTPEPNLNHKPSSLTGSVSVSPEMPPQEDSPDEFNDYIFNFIDQILVEENKALGQDYSVPSEQPLKITVETSEDNVFGTCGEHSTNGSTSLNQTSSPSWSYKSVADEKRLNTHVAQNIFTDSESIKQFNRGMEDANKFLPTSKPLVIDLAKYDLPSNGLNGRKHTYQSEDRVYEDERSSKQSAVYVEDGELSELFDKVLLGPYATGGPTSRCNEMPIPLDTKLPQNAKKTKKKSVDINTMLVSCAQAVASGDRRTAYEHLNQIRQHASTSGDHSQRLAHSFALGLEARLAGTGSQLYAANKSMTTISAAERLQAYQVYLSACPFKKIAMSFANRVIWDGVLNSSTLHIVDFGISYGFQWPIIIGHLSDLPNPPKLRITGIEYPQPGFRPAERLEETGRRLASYCKRFNVTFEFNAIPCQNWETIKIQDLKLQRNEFLAVNSLLRFHNLLDETVVCADSPRDKVLKLIRDMKPDIFTHTVVNGGYSAPFFVTRFKETLFHYSALFDMFDATIERENEQRLNFEKEFYGREALNVIACEGATRVERPEPYKQWQVRMSRAGLKIKPLNKEIMAKLRCMRVGYHKDFIFEEDGKWVFQGWKGRILYASSCWVPV